MNKDFTLIKYKELLTALDDYGRVTLRHDVDKKPKNSLATAYIERELGWKATYYFRAVPESWDESVILQIASLGHEIGYHYESLTTCQGNLEAAYDDFCRNLERLRALVPVSTISMHGSPKSKWDSRDLWEHYDYHRLGIDTESYLDTDFSKVFYLTDTGRRWDGFNVSVRDKIPEFQDRWTSQGLVYHSTDDIIRAVVGETFPRNVLITTHPQRWTNRHIPWVWELVLQNFKNLVKRAIVKNKV
ncbi:MAG: hypothetical protein IKM85_05295 [Bacteroidales bacterium]|nr:hypothetical protein [Bacteroidales bacterium]